MRRPAQAWRGLALTCALVRLQPSLVGLAVGFILALTGTAVGLFCTTYAPPAAPAVLAVLGVLGMLGVLGVRANRDSFWTSWRA